MKMLIERYHVLTDLGYGEGGVGELCDVWHRFCSLINGKDALGDAFKPTLKPRHSEMPKEIKAVTVRE